ncbi:MAG: PepSY domain-containing protein [Phormidesmis sp.]
MKNSLKTLLSLGLVTVLGTGGTILIANAQDSSPAATRDARAAQTVDNETNKGYEEEDEDENEAQEMAQYEALATITADQAKQTAEAAQDSTATKVELDEEDGSLVYEVEFANAEVLVDAGDGKILKTELEGEEEDDATEMPVSGSIQVPDTDGDDD